jgi:hypothetical protein
VRESSRVVFAAEDDTLLEDGSLGCGLEEEPLADQVFTGED